MSITTQRMEKQVPSEHELEVVSCGNVLYVRKGFVDEHTTIAKLTDDDTGQEYHSKNVMYVYGDSWYCFELKDSILVGRTFSGVFIVGGEEYAFRGKAVNFTPSSDETEEKKSSSRLMSLIPTVIIAVLVIVFAIMAWRNEPSDKTNSHKGLIKKEESKNVNETASSNVGKKTDEQLENQVPDSKTEESPNTTSTNTGNTQQDEKSVLVGFFDASKEKASENNGSDSKMTPSGVDNEHPGEKTQDRSSENSGDTGEREKKQQFVWDGEKQPSIILPKTAGNNGNEQQPPADAQGNGEETKQEEKKPEKVKTIAQPKDAQDTQKELQGGKTEKDLGQEKQQEDPPNTKVQFVRKPKRPEAPPLTQEQTNLQDNGEYSITNNMDIKNLDIIDKRGCKDVILVFCPDRYAEISPQDYKNKWNSLTGKVNNMQEGTIKEVKVIKPYRSDLGILDRKALNEGIDFKMEGLK